MADNWSMAGHQWAVEMLRRHVARGVARHAYLFTGPTGVGRLTLALRFAQALNCASPSVPGDPCGVCEDCRRVLALQHPDVTIVEAATEGAALRVDQIREQRRLMALKPFQARYRIVVFSRFQEANEAAANALLKTLEETPAHGILMLTAESAEGLLPTIVSRCEVMRLQPVPINEVHAFLRQRGAAEEQARLLAHISGGCPGIALQMLEDKDLLSFREQRLNDLAMLLSANRAGRFAYAEKLARDRSGMRRVLMLWLSFWRDVFWRAGGTSTPIANIDRVEQVEALARRMSLAEARLRVEDLDRALRRLDANVNPRLLVDALLLEWPR